MEGVDQEKKWRELKETYGQMTEDELCRVANGAFDLTPIAQEALQAVIADRGLKVPLVTAPPQPSGGMDIDDTYDAGHELVLLRQVGSEAEARELKEILAANFIASCLGPENVVDLEDFKESFHGGVELKVFSRDSRRAQSVLDLYAPDEQTVADQEEENKKYAIVCPKCRSEEIVFEGEDPATTENKFSWTCDDCGHQWKDDGIARSV
ncbi:MAG TPA: hypothetical protein VGN44_18890 [Candidatus Angelobacter sp.]|jgi:DNA-directed RNA polymerase subunit M/transcription elongation factor TFIIS